MFGDFGPSSQRHRIPRDHSPFGSFNRSHRPMFHDRDSEGPSMQRAGVIPNGTPEQNSSRTGGHVERIIPIQILGTPSPPPSQPAHQSTETGKTTTAQHSNEPSPPIVLGWSPETTTGDETVDRKYATQRHNTTENLQPQNLDAGNQRAKSEPPNAKWASGESTTSDSAPTRSPVPPFAETNPSPVGMTQLGANKSKVRENGGMATGCRNIPIVVEGCGSRERGSTKQKQNMGPPAAPSSSAPTSQKTRPQPDYPESTTPPPPPKKLTKDTMQIIKEIVEDVQSLEVEVNALPFTPKSAKNYIYLDEMLTRNLIKLDTIETEGREDIRLARRDCIKLIQKVISVLEGKSQESQLVLFDPSVQTAPDDMSNALVPIQLALTPTTSVTSPSIATAEAAMDIRQIDSTESSNIALNNNGGEEPMLVDKGTTQA